MSKDFLIISIIIFFILSIIPVGYMYYIKKNYPYISVEEEVNIKNNPLQTKISQKTIEYKVDDEKILLKSIYRYEISGIVGAVHNYSTFNERASNIGPVDFGIVWGKLTDEKYYKYLKFSIASRMLSIQFKKYNSYDYSDDAMKENKYVSKMLFKNISNNHLIPGDKVIDYALQHTFKNDKVSIKGYLVDVYKHYYGKWHIYWPTSIRRDDFYKGILGNLVDDSHTGCEIIYVQQIQVNNKLYSMHNK